jgi:hypothetical protein
MFLMVTIRTESWREFEARLERYFDLPAERRHQLIFRGQPDARWGLRPTIDRLTWPDDGTSRKEKVALLIREFEIQCLGLSVPLSDPASRRQWELLGRHHGLPTSILDWTTSPFVAAFFAFADRADDAADVAVYTFDRRYFEERGSALDPIEIWEEPSDYRPNLRAVEQGAVFMKTHRGDPLDRALKPYLWQYTIPATEGAMVLAKLAEMRITHRHLFRDVDHATRSAVLQVMESRMVK